MCIRDRWDYADLKEMCNMEAVEEFRKKALNPENPKIDVYKRQVRAIKLAEGDEVVGVCICREGGTVLTVTENGKGRRSDIEMCIRDRCISIWAGTMSSTTGTSSASSTWRPPPSPPGVGSF